jgi:hypothetical protein
MVGKAVAMDCVVVVREEVVKKNLDGHKLHLGSDIM